jgi:hypothetical protein
MPSQLAQEKKKLISSAEEQYKKVRAEPMEYKRLKINAGYNALLAKQQGRRCSQRGSRVLKDFEERWTKVARYESAAVRDEGKALVADYEASRCSNEGD